MSNGLINRQYVGARYVPKIMGEWNKALQYEALSVVTYMGNSFTSKIPVPANIDITNEGYWINTGNYNAQVESYREKTIALENNINTEIQNRENADKHLNNVNVNNMSNRKFVFIGDSYTQMPTPTTSCIGYCINALGLTVNQYHNIGVSGVDMSGFIEEVNNYSYNDENEITDIVIIGGINDCHSKNNTGLMDKINTLYYSIINKFPNATIYAGFCGNGLYGLLVNEYPGFTYENVTNIKYVWFANFSDKPKVIYMPNLDDWCYSPNVTDYLTGGSGLHPIGVSAMYLGQKIANILKNGTNNFSCYTYNTYNYVSNIEDAASNIYTTVKEYKTDSNYVLIISEGGVSFNTPKKLPNVINLYTSDIDSKTSVSCYVNKENYTPIAVTCYDENNKLITLSGSLYIHENKIDLMITGNLYINYKVKSFWTPYCEVLLPLSAL